MTTYLIQESKKTDKNAGGPGLYFFMGLLGTLVATCLLRRDRVVVTDELGSTTIDLQ